MNVRREDPLFQACLEEILGGVKPPDLSERILAAWQARRAVGAVPPSLVSPPLPSQAVTKVNGAPRPLVARRSSTTRTRSRWWAAAGVLTVTACLGVWLWRGRSGPADPPSSPARAAADHMASSPGSRARPELAPAAPHRPDIKPQTLDNAPEFADPAAVASSSDSDGAWRREPAAAPLTDAHVVAAVNTLLHEKWSALGLHTQGLDNELQWCRRAFLRLLGRIPTVEELDRFAATESSDRRAAWVQRLQEDPAYRPEYEEHWAQYWSTVLIGRTGGGPDEPADREGLLTYLRQAEATRLPYDQMVYQLLTATGDLRSSDARFNGAANYLAAHWDPQAVQVTAHVARVFQGRRLRCVQCHDHPNDADGSQHDFWAMNAFFRQTKLERLADSRWSLINADFQGEGARPDWEHAEIYYQLPDGRTHAAYPEYPDSPPVSPSGRLRDVNRRQELARRIAGSAALSRAVVNRYWEYFLGYGFTLPVDDMGPHNPPTQPELIELLAQQFEAHDYQLDRLSRWITLSDAFNRSSQIDGSHELADTPESGGVPWFSRYYTRQLQQEAVYDSLALVAEARASGKRDAERIEWLGQFSRKLQTDDGAEENQFRGDVNQSLTLMNGELTDWAVNPDAPSGVLAGVLRSQMPLADKVQHLFLAAVARQPTAREQKLINRMAEQAGPQAALQDIWWALLNSNEFILDH